MRSASVFVGFALASTACAKAVPLAEVASAPAPRAAPVLPAAGSQATACHAEPSTVYGAEPVLFEIEGSSSRLPVEVLLVDASSQVIARGRTPLPGSFRLSETPSGDFTLQVGSNHVACIVTVNRELSRATEAGR